MKKYVRAGVRPSDNGNYIFDYTYNYPEDLIHIEPPQLYRSEHGTNVYWFGYRFNDDVSSKDRTDFIGYRRDFYNFEANTRDFSHEIQPFLTCVYFTKIL